MPPAPKSRSACVTNTAWRSRRPYATVWFTRSKSASTFRQLDLQALRLPHIASTIGRGIWHRRPASKLVSGLQTHNKHTRASSEGEAGAKLQLARASERARGRRAALERRRRYQAAVGVAHTRTRARDGRRGISVCGGVYGTYDGAVEKVECIDDEIEPVLFAERESTAQAEIHVGEIGEIVGVARQPRNAASRGSGKGAHFGTGHTAVARNGRPENGGADVRVVRLTRCSGDDGRYRPTIQQLPGKGIGEVFRVGGFPDDASDKAMPLVEVGIGVVAPEVVRVENPIGAEESAVGASGLTIVECLAVRVIEQQLETVAHGLVQGEHQSVVPGVDDAGLVENEARTGVDTRRVERHRGGQGSRGGSNR